MPVLLLLFPFCWWHEAIFEYEHIVAHAQGLLKCQIFCCLPGFLFSAQIEAQYACFSPVVVIVTNPLLLNRICCSCGLRECSGSGRAGLHHGAACELNSSLRCNSYDLDIWHLNSINVHGILLDIFLEVAKAGHQQCEISVWKWSEASSHPGFAEIAFAS